nr:GNAT family N-acetyltransferase [Halopiger djelfimassiliensis]
MGDLVPAVIETDRLRLEAIGSETVDVRELYAICSADPEIETITEYLTWAPHRTPKETLEFVDHVTEQYESDDGASYLIRPRDGAGDSDEIAGVAGFGIDWETRTMTIGIWLRKRFWGRGYSGERAAAFVELAFEPRHPEVRRCLRRQPRRPVPKLGATERRTGRLLPVQHFEGRVGDGVDGRDRPVSTGRIVVRAPPATSPLVSRRRYESRTPLN